MRKKRAKAIPGNRRRSHRYTYHSGDEGGVPVSKNTKDVRGKKKAQSEGFKVSQMARGKSCRKRTSGDPRKKGVRGETLVYGKKEVERKKKGGQTHALTKRRVNRDKKVCLTREMLSEKFGHRPCRRGRGRG